MEKQMEILDILAIKKAYLHSLRYLTDEVIGILVGKVDGNQITKVTDAYPLSHSRILAPTLESAMEIIEALIQDKNEKIVGIYEAPLQNQEDLGINSSEIGQRILEKINQNTHVEPIYLKIFDQPQMQDSNQIEDQDETHILTCIVSQLVKNNKDYSFKKLVGSGVCQKLFEQVKQNIQNLQHRKIIDFDSHFEDISLDITNSFVQ
ncbi:hypothetical protein PPERSA_00747 [Pseudocohnilembus persalinus]|uniref:MPN domain-containing protein n=1 Tax=Pseudocohnilembus persalinus TaxID=266149 RepID=A0A0V0R4R3_PSEPJ|nr:hypothetical protein PPERSA_00747 [Pseudocohnilembus persalinus]|eukprot:KRX09468.1 hypothetical protein PPERSA_00747 [Pseudocohnilembus persalinus]